MYVDRLTVAYGARQAVRGVSLAIRPGTVTAIIGASGSGKSTVLCSLNRLNELTPGCVVGGEVRLNETNIAELDPTVLRRSVGMVFQRPNPFPMSIRENVLYGVKATRLRVNHDETVKSALTKAALWEEVKHRLRDSAYALSLGQQQRLCVARTLAVSPEVILMDEPAASLDPASTAQLEETIEQMRLQYTVVIVTHNMQQARRLSDYTAFIDQGRLVEFGPTSDLFADPKDELTRRYIRGEMV